MDVEFDDFSTVRLVEGGGVVRMRAEERFGSVRALAGKVGLGERHLYWFLDGRKGVRVYVWRRILKVLGQDLERMVKLERTKRAEGSVVVVGGREELCRVMAERGVSLRRLAEEMGVDYNALFRALHLVGALTHEVACELAGVPVEGVSPENVKLALKLALEALRGERPQGEGEWKVADAVVRMRFGVAEELVAPWGSIKVNIDPKANYRLLDAEAVREVAGRLSEVWGLTSWVADAAGLKPLYEFLMGHQKGLRGEVILRVAALSGSVELARRVTRVELALRGSKEEGDNLMGDAMLKPAAFASAVNPGMILEARSVEGTPRRAIPLHTLMTRIAQLFLRVRGVSGEEVETRTELGGRRLDALTFTVSLGGVEEGGLAKETVDFIRGFLPRGEMVVLEEGGLLAFALEVKTFSDRLDPGEVGKMVERVEGLRRRLGRCAVIPVMLNAGAFSEDLRKFFGREPGATITSGDVTLTLRGKPKNGYYVVWAEMKDMKAAIMIVDCWRAPRGDLASTLATIISVMAGMPRTWGQRKRASDAPYSTLRNR
ncbi:MAG: hypothetical protein QXH00_01090 [Candidatus Jordarchaeales archaeon]